MEVGPRIGRLGTRGLLGMIVALGVLVAAIVAVTGGGSKAVAASGGTLSGPNPTDAQLAGYAGANWSTIGGDLGNTRYSTLKQINKSNASKLHLVWQETFGPKVTAANFNGGAAIEAEGQPVVYDGVMYLATPQGDVVATNAATGQLIWRWKSNVTPKTNLTSGESADRGLDIGGGNVYVETGAGALVALNGKTGKMLWSNEVAIKGTKLESPATPLYYDGKIYVGVSGDETAEGHIDSYNAKTGKRLWRSFTVCASSAAQSVPPNADGQCPKTSAVAAVGGGGNWTYPALDVKDGLVIATTGNPSSSYSVSTETGDYKYTSSIVAFKMNNGHIAWAFQGVHHDLWDYDCLTPPVVFSHEVGGKQATGVEYTCKDDQHYELDAKTGKPLLPVTEALVPTAAGGLTPDPQAQSDQGASNTQPIPAGNTSLQVSTNAQGQPYISGQGTGAIVPQCASPDGANGTVPLPNPAPDGTNYVYSCTFAAPGSKDFIAAGIYYMGGQDDDPLSYDPKTGQMNFCEKVSVYGREEGQAKSGGVYTGVTTGWAGSIAAVTVANNNLSWDHHLMANPDSNCFGGTADTASGIVFGSSNKGTIYALNEANGNTLWKYRAPDYVAAPPIVYSVDGKEYMAIYVGGQVALVGGETKPHYDRLMVFSVDASATKTSKKLIVAAGSSSTAKSGVNGAALFSENCGGCHTLAAAKSHGTQGPNLDQLKPSESVIATQVTNGGGGMPAFGKSLGKAGVKAVSQYVYNATHTH